MEQIYDPSPDEAVYQSVRAALETARTKAAAAINDAMVSAYWEIGKSSKRRATAQNTASI